MQKLSVSGMSLVFACLAGAGGVSAQNLLVATPRGSQAASITQRIGLTDVTIWYSRPVVNGRKIWGGIVPYDAVWRAGANENTTIQFSDPVSVEGKALDKGTYGLHMIPNADEWTVIFSKNSTAWGSFTYDEKEDALRVKVKPQTGEFHEALAYDFDQLKPDSVAVLLRWEKVAVPFQVSANVKEITLTNIRNQLRGLSQYSWIGWDEAANYLLASKTNLDEALKWSDRAIQTEKRFDTLTTKSQILAAMGRTQEAADFRQQALAIASPLQIHLAGRQLQGQKQQEEAFKIFRANAKKNPNEWFTHVGMARVYVGEGKFDDAMKEAKMALEIAPDPQKPQVETLIKRLSAKDDINR